MIVECILDFRQKYIRAPLSLLFVQIWALPDLVTVIDKNPKLRKPQLYKVIGISDSILKRVMNYNYKKIQLKQKLKYKSNATIFYFQYKVI